MPEAAGSSSVPRDASSHRPLQAGFPNTGEPAFASGAPFPVAASPACPVLGPCPAGLAGRSLAGRHATPTSRFHHEPFGQIEADAAADPALRRSCARSAAISTTRSRRGPLPAGHNPRHRRTDLILTPSEAYRDQIRTDALNRLRAAGGRSVHQSIFRLRRPQSDHPDHFPGLLRRSRPDRPAARRGFHLFGQAAPGRGFVPDPGRRLRKRAGQLGLPGPGHEKQQRLARAGRPRQPSVGFRLPTGPRQFRQGVYDSQMRLLMHATDPDHGEPRLGGPDSKGCVRISAAANAFLDRRGILDRHYEALAGAETDRDLWLLRADRDVTPHSGSYLVVGDSSMSSASR